MGSDRSAPSGPAGPGEDWPTARDRLRGLLESTQLVTGQLSLPDVLTEVVHAAAELVGARYAALGVLGPETGLADFVHTGMPPDAVERIGHLPQGKGLLGALIEDPRPIRLARITDDPRSAGFPEGHPPMEGFLGVPIRVRDEVFGNLYLTESTRGGFSAEDEELARALAATAAVAVQNARLYQVAQDRGEWMAASTALLRRLLGEPDVDAARPLHLIADQTQRTAHADFVTVIRRPRTGNTVVIEVAVGPDAERVRGLEVPLEGSLAGEVLRTGEALRLSVPQRGEERPATLEGLDVGPLLVLPLHGAAGVEGVLTVARRAGRQPFTADDLGMAAGYADQAVVALELAQARAERQRTEMVDERERIAADLHDQVIQRLFAAGLSIQATVGRVASDEARERLEAVVEDLDTTIRQIRTTIFRLQQPTAAVRTGLRTEIVEICAELAGALGFDPAVRFSGVLDVVPQEVREDVAAVLREGLTNVARHAHAAHVEVDVRAEDGELAVEVVDDGVGPGTSSRRSGTANLRHRAERRGGRFDFGPAPAGGSRLTWVVPLPF